MFRGGAAPYVKCRPLRVGERTSSTADSSCILSNVMTLQTLHKVLVQTIISPADDRWSDDCSCYPFSGPKVLIALKMNPFHRVYYAQVPSGFRGCVQVPQPHPGAPGTRMEGRRLGRRATKELHASVQGGGESEWSVDNLHFRIRFACVSLRAESLSYWVLDCFRSGMSWDLRLPVRSRSHQSWFRTPAGWSWDLLTLDHDPSTSVPDPGPTMDHSSWLLPTQHCCCSASSTQSFQTTESSNFQTTEPSNFLNLTLNFLDFRLMNAAYSVIL